MTHLATARRNKFSESADDWMDCSFENELVEEAPDGFDDFEETTVPEPAIHRNWHEKEKWGVALRGDQLRTAQTIFREAFDRASRDDDSMAELLLQVADRLAQRDDPDRDQAMRVTGRACELLGARLATYIAGERATAVVRDWVAGITVPSPAAITRLRAAVRAAEIIAEFDGNDGAQAWIQGSNPELRDVSPARLLRETPPAQAAEAVVRAAHAYVAA